MLNGAGEGLLTVRERYKEPPSIPQADVVVCAGAFDLPVPARLIRSGSGASTIRPARGGTAEWLTSVEAEMRFGI